MLEIIDPLSVSYSQAVLVQDARRLLFISGQTPARPDGSVSDDIVDQCRAAWAKVVNLLDRAGMTTADLVKVGVFLADRRWREASAQVRQEVLGEHSPALTVVMAGIFDGDWLVEIEAVAAV